jgi:hypothetical protein
MIKYSSELGKVEKSIYVEQYNDFFHFITDNNYYSNLLFMSSSVINRKLFCKYYAKAMDYASSFCHIYPVFLLLYNKESGIYLSKDVICKHGKPDPRYHWFWGTVYQNMLRQFSEIPFITQKQVHLIAKKWLNLNIKWTLGACVVLSLRKQDKNLIRKTLKNYYHYLYSLIQRILLFPIYIIVHIFITRSNLVNFFVKKHKKYEKVINMNLDI